MHTTSLTLDRLSSEGEDDWKGAQISCTSDKIIYKDKLIYTGQVYGIGKDTL